MLSEFKKSLENILNERVSSPLSGAFILSWFIWNWKIIYLSIFVSEDKLVENKLDYIASNYMSISHLLWYPILSTLGFIIVYPFLATGAFWINVKFNKWKTDIKNIEENKQLLSLEQSISLREEIRNQEDKFDRLLQKKTDEIILLNKEIENYKTTAKSLNQNIAELPSETRTELFKAEYETLKNNKKLFSEFQKIAPRALKQLTMFSEGSNIDRSLFDYFLANDFITKMGNNTYEFTEKGHYFNREMINEKFGSL